MMQTVNFQCGHCGKLMAVSTDFLGQQVRCPHCSQVVVAPATNGAAAPPPAPSPAPAPDPFGNLTEHEDIFSTKSGTDDALFDQPDLPKIDFPRDPEPLPPTVNLPAPFAPGLTPVSGQTFPGPGDNHVPASYPTFTNEQPISPLFGQETQSVTSPGATDVSSPLPQTESPSVAAARAKRDGGMGGMVFILLVFLPTLIWAIGASIMCYSLWMQASRNQSRGSSFDAMPDDGDSRGFKPGVPKKVGRLDVSKSMATRPLPDHLKVKLRETIRIGDLEVTPTGVEVRKVGVIVEGFSEPQPCEHPSLVLNLKLKNVSDGWAFAPLDNYFDRQYKGVGSVPLTLLEAGPQTFFGGPAKWIPVIRDEKTKNDRRQWVEGRKNLDLVGLAPGEEKKDYVCTDGEDARMAAYLFGGGGRKPYQGDLLYRVRVRRGPVKHRGKLVSATAVIGVMFSSDDYRKKTARQ